MEPYQAVHYAFPKVGQSHELLAKRDIDIASCRVVAHQNVWTQMGAAYMREDQL
jgi:hypothetical protein